MPKKNQTSRTRAIGPKKPKEIEEHTKGKLKIIPKSRDSD